MEDAKLEKIRDYFSRDLFATEVTGIRIEEVREGFARCSVSPEPKHLNAEGFLMGGALYSLADLAFAAAANYTEISETGYGPICTLTGGLTYLSPGKSGGKIIAEARSVKDGKSTCCYQVLVFDDRAPERILASGQFVGFRRPAKP